MPALFVTGTDTGVGKTLVTGLLGRYLLEKGYTVITQKWIQTGSKGFPEDIDTHLRLMHRERQDVHSHLSQIAPFVFRFPSSPHLASELEKRPVRAHKIKQSFKLLSGKFDYVVVEGTGGALVPFNTRKLVIDIARELDLPVLIVAQNRLGAINHTLLTIEAIRRRKMRTIGIIFNSQKDKTEEIVLRDNPEIVRTLTKVDILGNLPWLQDKNLLYEKFIPIGDSIITHLERK